MDEHHHHEELIESISRVGAKIFRDLKNFRSFLYTCFVKKLLPPSKLYVAQSKIHKAGRGVFASVAIKQGELIERCPVIEIPEHEGPSVNESMLVTYIYYLGKNKERLMLALGFGSIYNHTETPNAEYHERYREKTIDFIALKEIKKDQEITVKYDQGSHKDSHPLWFVSAD